MTDTKNQGETAPESSPSKKAYTAVAVLAHPIPNRCMHGGCSRSPRMMIAVADVEGVSSKESARIGASCKSHVTEVSEAMAHAVSVDRIKRDNPGSTVDASLFSVRRSDEVPS